MGMKIYYKEFSEAVRFLSKIESKNITWKLLNQKVLLYCAYSSVMKAISVLCCKPCPFFIRIYKDPVDVPEGFVFCLDWYK